MIEDEKIPTLCQLKELAQDIDASRQGFIDVRSELNEQIDYLEHLASRVRRWERSIKKKMTFRCPSLTCGWFLLDRNWQVEYRNCPMCGLDLDNSEEERGVE